MNVAITRARHFLWVVGNSKCLMNNENWRGLIQKKDPNFIKYTFANDPCHADILNQTLVK
jgi:hypothetical protein